MHRKSRTKFTKLFHGLDNLTHEKLMNHPPFSLSALCFFIAPVTESYNHRNHFIHISIFAFFCLFIFMLCVYCIYYITSKFYYSVFHHDPIAAVSAMRVFSIWVLLVGSFLVTLTSAQNLRTFFGQAPSAAAADAVANPTQGKQTISKHLWNLLPKSLQVEDFICGPLIFMLVSQ